METAQFYINIDNFINPYFELFLILIIITILLRDLEKIKIFLRY